MQELYKKEYKLYDNKVEMKNIESNYKCVEDNMNIYKKIYNTVSKSTF
jgi:hypothetical protein